MLTSWHTPCFGNKLLIFALKIFLNLMLYSSSRGNWPDLLLDRIQWQDSWISSGSKHRFSTSKFFMHHCWIITCGEFMLGYDDNLTIFHILVRLFLIQVKWEMKKMMSKGLQVCLLLLMVGRLQGEYAMLKKNMEKTQIENLSKLSIIILFFLDV